jgi:metallo-beta-lactamase family protein
MKIQLVGAAGGEVTGSAFLVETPRARVLVDCGLFQGGKKSEALNRPPGGPRSRLDAVLITHAHLDHTGRLPLLAKRGYAGPVFATPATHDMTALILRDSARLQVQDAERQNRRRERAGVEGRAPLYTPEDAETIIKTFTPAPYGKVVTVAPGVRAVWAEAGHILGSASIQLSVDEDGREKHVVFSGDLGRKGAPILRDFEPFRQADLVFMESTYGDREHRPFKETLGELLDIVNDAVARRGKILVPTFAVGRVQLLVTLFAWAFRTKRVKPFPLFLDSPMAIEATKIYVRHRELFDEEMQKLIRERPLREDLRTLTPTATAAESMKINSQPGPCLVMAGAGMCNAGRILHHFKQNLWKPETHVLIVGYQGPQSLGRRLIEGEKTVKIHGETIAVRAQVHTLGGFSAHAGQADLLHWIGAIAPSKPRIVINHGEDKQRAALAKLIHRNLGLTPKMPAMNEVIEL